MKLNLAHTTPPLRALCRPRACALFFTVYGPWGRRINGAPDAHSPRPSCQENRSGWFNQGRMERDFTYIDEQIVEKACCAARQAWPTAEEGFDPLQPKSTNGPGATGCSNIGNSQQCRSQLHRPAGAGLGVKAIHNGSPMQPGDVGGNAALTPSTAAMGWIRAPHTLEVVWSASLSWLPELGSGGTTAHRQPVEEQPPPKIRDTARWHQPEGQEPSVQAAAPTTRARPSERSGMRHQAGLEFLTLMAKLRSQVEVSVEEVAG